MKNPVILTANEGREQFYPTPESVAQEMLLGIEWNQIKSILEPSAGKGDLVRFAIKTGRIREAYRVFDFDCIEIDPNLRQILKYNFSEAAHKSLRDRYDKLDGILFSERTFEQKSEWRRLRSLLNEFSAAKIHIVHDDFLTYSGHKKYDLILMNPPFADGCRHLLKAIELQKEGGQIVCLLNAETIRNPFTNMRRVLLQLLDKYQAQITYLENAFANAERRADVDVAVIRISIPDVCPRSTIYERLKKAAEESSSEYDATDIVAGDYIEQRVQCFNVECSAGKELIREYKAMVPYIQSELATPSHTPLYNKAILTLTVGTESDFSQQVDVNEYLRKVRLKYWNGLFHNEEFTGRLTSNLREQYQKTVETMADYDFTFYNIQQVLFDMNAKLVDGLKETVESLFDKLTQEHAYYPECAKNIHYFNGWKSNKAHKIGKKAIIPSGGMFSGYKYSKETFDVYAVYRVVSDIEKVFNYLDGGMTQDVDLHERLKAASNEGRQRNIECKYFVIDLFKKGTMHIKFTNMEIVEKLNIYAACGRNWLPPNYGKVRYADMCTEEQTVVDAFQGKEAYEKVMANSEYYLVQPTGNLLALMQGA